MSDKIKENISAHNFIAKKYDLKHTEIYNPIEQDRIKNTIKILLRKLNKKNPKILDFGAGTGNLTKHFLNFGCEVTACDVSQKSLDILKEKFKENNKNIKTVLISGKKLPFKKNCFDIVATYSVLHHIPNYLFAVEEMIRVTKKGGIIYIDHEVNSNYFFPDKYLKKYKMLTKQSNIDLLIRSIKTKELFSYNFIKMLFIKIFLNRKYGGEGDIHIWPDDHIEWQNIKKICKNNNCKIFEEKDYLMCRPKGGVDLYNRYRDKCNDTKYIFIKRNG